MRDKVKDAIQMDIKRRDFLEKGFELFSKRNIESVAMADVAKASGYGIATLYRYFSTKADFVIAVATWKWKEYYKDSGREAKSFEGMNGAERYEFFLDAFLDLYRNYPDLLCFNQFFNIYIRSEKVERASMEPYQAFISVLADRFHEIYSVAQQDHTMSTEMPEKMMFSLSLHLMLAAVTRYAVGLVYNPDEKKAEEEILILKDMLLRRFVREA